jgi:rhodanese-related sulfurtransferase
MLAVVEKHIWKSLDRRGPRAAIILLVVAALASQGCAMLRRRAEERPPYRKVSPPIAYEIIRDTPGLLILDLRPPRAFHGDTGHIYRAYNIPQDQIPFRLLELSSFREETFLVYCDTAKCAEDGMAVLISSGFENAILIDGGIDGWIARGFRTVLPAELAGKPQQASQGEAEKSGQESPPVRSAAQPAFQQETPGATLPAICPEPHVPVQKPP